MALTASLLTGAPLLAQTRAAPEVPLQYLVTTDDYPKEAWRNGEQGDTAFTLTLNAKGRVAKCEITNSSGSQKLDRQACKLLIRRARFSPARDENEKAVTSWFSSKIRWRVPGSSYTTPCKASVADGTANACS